MLLTDTTVWAHLTETQRNSDEKQITLRETSEWAAKENHM